MLRSTGGGKAGDGAKELCLHDHEESVTLLNMLSFSELYTTSILLEYY